uniref:THIF-type NAD/FAD binding fold domain-containing protein n=1 Tax=Corethron hystrix TaxID=216773 RepID=A0A7S1FT97_9STRA
MATDNKYDRQIRLWGPVGQRRLGTSSVLLVGTSASGTETAKNLVLPGVGALEILDDAPLPAAQSANFFLPASNSSSICAASAACSSLAELNSDVACSFRRVDDLARLGDEEWAAALAGKSLAVGADLPLATLRALSRSCAAEGVPLVAVRAYGLIGYVRIQTAGAHDVVETRREGFHPDLRVRDPFPELRAMAGAVDWDDRGMDAAEHAHVPFVLILVEALRRWRKERTDEAVPRTAAEKKRAPGGRPIALFRHK